MFTQRRTIGRTSSEATSWKLVDLRSARWNRITCWLRQLADLQLTV